MNPEKDPMRAAEEAHRAAEEAVDRSRNLRQLIALKRALRERLLRHLTEPDEPPPSH